jgi:hypothetical protein
MDVNAAIAAAKAAAAQTVATPAAATGSNVVPLNAGSTAVATPGVKAKNYSLDDISTGSMNVDEYLKVKEFGLLIGNSTKLIQSITVEIDMTEVAVCEVCKAGNPAQYVKTFNGVDCTTGGTWPAAVERMQRIDPKARPYKSADIPMTLVDNAVAVDNSVILEAGKRIGHSLSTTNRGNFQTLLKEIADAGQTNGVVQVKITAEPKSNKNGNTWGVLAFQLLEEAGE